MNRINALSGLVLVLALAGCASVKTYPRCYLFRTPTAQDLSEADREIGAFLDGVIGVKDFSIARDNVVVKAFRPLHLGIAQAWPALGCVNLRRAPPENSTTNDKWIVAHCGQYLAEIVDVDGDDTARRRTEIAGKYDPYLTCH